MTLRKNAVKVLAALLPAGVMGMSVALASTPPSTPPTTDTDVAAAKVGETDVAARLAMIRDAVSTVTEDQAARDAAGNNVRTAWWANWHGPGFGWRNGGWGNGGWHNWRNGWHNWGNGWHNWGNWHNW